MRVSDKREAPRPAELAPLPAAATKPDATASVTRPSRVTRASRGDAKAPKRGGMKITADALHAACYGETPKPSHTPEELAALEANNDPRLTRSGVVIVPPSRDTRGGTPFPPRCAYDGSQYRDDDED